MDQYRSLRATKKPKAPTMSLQEMLGNRPQTRGMMGPPAPPPPINPALLGGTFAAPAVSPMPMPPGLQAMQGTDAPGLDMISGMMAARNRGLLRERTQEPGPMPGMPPAGPPAPAPGVARVAPGMAPYQPPGMAPAGALTPDAKAMIDAFTGKRVHKGMGGQQLGMEGVSPALKYMLYAQRGRRHTGMGGKDIY